LLHGLIQIFFIRVLGTTAPGSGLGLAIVIQISDLHHADVILGTPSGGIGLQFDVAFPKFSSTNQANLG